MSFLGTEVMSFNDNCENMSATEALMRKKFLEDISFDLTWTDDVAGELEELARLSLQGMKTEHTQQGKTLTIENVDIHELSPTAQRERVEQVRAYIRKILWVSDFEAVAYLALTGVPF